MWPVRGTYSMCLVCVCSLDGGMSSAACLLCAVCVLCTRGVAFALHIASAACGCVSVKGQQVFSMCRACSCLVCAACSL